MWNDYFYNLQLKYDMRLSTKKTLVIRLDGKDITKNKDIDLLHRYKGNFLDTLEKAASYFTKKYNCYAIFGTDEISFIIPDQMKLFEDLDSEKNIHSNEVVSLFSQYFFSYFNMLYGKENVFFHSKCFSIPENKITSYIKYRSNSIQNVLSVYFLKKHGVEFNNLTLNQKLEECKKQLDYNSFETYEKGILYFNGKKIDINDFFEGKISDKDEAVDEEIIIEI